MTELVKHPWRAPSPTGLLKADWDRMLRARSHQILGYLQGWRQQPPCVSFMVKKFFLMFNCNFLYFNSCLLSFVLSMSTTEKVLSLSSLLPLRGICTHEWDSPEYLTGWTVPGFSAFPGRTDAPGAPSSLCSLDKLSPVSGPCVSSTEETRTGPSSWNMVPVVRFFLLILCWWCGYSSNILLDSKLNDLILYVYGVYSLLSKFWTHCWEKYGHNDSFFLLYSRNHLESCLFTC